jgi:trehalose 6-phosphate phosphatase
MIPPPLTMAQALFLDFDGTLVELAETPDSIAVPDELPELLRRLHRRLDGALAIVSGRALESIDHYLAPLRLPGAGLHGAQRRPSADAAVDSLPARPELAAHLRARFPADDGFLVEDKGAAVAVHFRRVPEQAETVRAQLSAWLAQRRDLELIGGKCVYELRPSGVDKGRAVSEFCRELPYARRRPVFVGDDLTDEAAICVVQAAGGYGVKVGEGPSAAQYRLPDPAAVLAWLSAAS